MPSLSDLFATCPSGHLVIESLTTEEEEIVYAEAYGTDPETCPKLCCYGRSDRDAVRLRMAPTSPEVHAQDGATDSDSGCHRAQSNGHGALGACAAQAQRLARSAWKCVQLLLALAVVACQGTAKPTWHAAEGLQEAAQDAATSWCVASYGEFCPVVDDPSGAELRWGDRSDDKSAVEFGACGWYRYEGTLDSKTWHEIVVPVDFLAATWDDGAPRCLWETPTGYASEHTSLVAIIAHELGHAGDAPDVYGAESNGILMGSDRSVALPTQRDVELLDSY